MTKNTFDNWDEDGKFYKLPKRNRKNNEEETNWNWLLKTEKPTTVHFNLEKKMDPVQEGLSALQRYSFDYYTHR